MKLEFIWPEGIYHDELDGAAMLIMWTNIMMVRSMMRGQRGEVKMSIGREMLACAPDYPRLRVEAI